MLGVDGAWKLPQTLAHNFMRNLLLLDLFRCAAFAVLAEFRLLLRWNCSTQQELGKSGGGARRAGAGNLSELLWRRGIHEPTFISIFMPKLVQCAVSPSLALGLHRLLRSHDFSCVPGWGLFGPQCLTQGNFLSQEVDGVAAAGPLRAVSCILREHRPAVQHK